MRYFFPIILLLTALGLGTYAYLGGLRAPTVALETLAAPVLLAGQPYHDRVQNPRFGELFRAAKQQLDDGRAPAGAALANVYYSYPQGPKDSVRAFIGLVVPDSTSRPLPPGWRYRFVAAGRRVVVARLREVSFQLAPAKLETATLDFIKNQKLRREPFFLEQFGPEPGRSELRVGVQ